MSDKYKKIIAADGNETDLITIKEALGSLYNVFAVTSVKTLFLLLESIVPDLILLDAEMPRVNGNEVIRALKSAEQTARIPIILLLKNVTGEESGTISTGATDYLIKPLSQERLLNRTAMYISERSRDNEKNIYC